MTDQERAIVRILYELQMELFDAQGDEIKALREANASLMRSHEIIAKLMKATAELANFS